MKSNLKEMAPLIAGISLVLALLGLAITGVLTIIMAFTKEYDYLFPFGYFSIGIVITLFIAHAYETYTHQRNATWTPIIKLVWWCNFVSLILSYWAAFFALIFGKLLWWVPLAETIFIVVVIVFSYFSAKPIPTISS